MSNHFYHWVSEYYLRMFLFSILFVAILFSVSLYIFSIIIGMIKKFFIWIFKKDFRIYIFSCIIVTVIMLLICLYRLS